LSVNTSVALRLPWACGANEIDTLQVLLPLVDGKLPVQVVVSGKSAGLAPVMAMLLIDSGPVPPFVSVTVCAELLLSRCTLPKPRVPGLGLAWGTPYPVPLKETLCVDPEVPFALSVNIRVALRLPVALGVKLTVMEQDDPAATDPLQLSDSLKSPALVPVIVILAIVSVPVPPLLKVKEGLLTVVPTGVLLKTSLLTDSAAFGIPVPVPLNVALCVAPDTPPALSVTVKDPLSGPVDCGSKVTLIVQNEPAATDVPQLFVWPKFPDTEMLEMLSAAVPPLVSVTGCALLVVFTAWLAKFRAVGFRLACGVPVPVPLTLTVCVEFATPPELSVMVITPLRDPEALGVNVSETVQLELTATDWPEQPSELIANSGESFDFTVLIFSAALPELVTVKDS